MIDAIVAATPEGAAAASAGRGRCGCSHDREADRRLLALLPARYSTGSGGCSAAAEIVSGSQVSLQLAQEARVDRVRHRRLAVGHVRARPCGAGRGRRGRTPPRSPGRACRGRSPPGGPAALARSSSKPSTVGRKPLSAMIPAGRGRSGPEPERVRHHRSLREAAEDGALGRDPVLGEQPSSQATSSRDRSAWNVSGSDSRPAATTYQCAPPGGSDSGPRARGARAGAARGRACRAAGTGRSRRRRVRGAGRALPRASAAGRTV